MKAKEVMQILNISRVTLWRYVKQGLIKVDSQINGQYRYNKESVLRRAEYDICVSNICMHIFKWA